MPTQKFWGKSAELNTDGRIRVVLTRRMIGIAGRQRPAFAIIAGEKYVEPVGTMTIIHETTGQKAVVTFKSKGMFSAAAKK
jgi:hypothetical protein